MRNASEIGATPLFLPVQTPSAVYPLTGQGASSLAWCTAHLRDSCLSPHGSTTWHCHPANSSVCIFLQTPHLLLSLSLCLCCSCCLDTPLLLPFSPYYSSLKNYLRCFFPEDTSLKSPLPRSEWVKHLSGNSLTFL